MQKGIIVRQREGETQEEAYERLKNDLIENGQVIPAGNTPMGAWAREGILRGWLPIPLKFVGQIGQILDDWIDAGEHRTYHQAVERLREVFENVVELPRNEDRLPEDGHGRHSL